MPHTLAYGIALALILPGAFMAFIPFLPAVPYMFVVTLAFGLYERFATLSGGEIAILLVITILSVVVDHLAGMLGAKLGGAHTKSLLWGMAGMLVGMFIIPALGSFLGLALGVLISELYYKKEHVAAVKATAGAVLGRIAGIAANVFLAFVFAGLFAFFAFS
ncbi:MAG TPA: DUF456 domain-containing protein [Candidatus Paceibacterota bacterium]|nr:DUF456 domain-containing protein [Candidatus Paceibacterota bacterium]